jgi:hypothetical protein
MTEGKPVACSLDSSELERRLAAIGAVGAEGLIARDVVEGQHRLRFRSNAATRKRLEGIVAAEAECCAFLDISLTEAGGELLLSIAAPEDGQAVADELAGAFAGGRR